MGSPEDELLDTDISTACMLSLQGKSVKAMISANFSKRASFDSNHGLSDFRQRYATPYVLIVRGKTINWRLFAPNRSGMTTGSPECVEKIFAPNIDS